MRPSLLQRVLVVPAWWSPPRLPSEWCPACPGPARGWSARRRRGSTRGQPRLFPPSSKSNPLLNPVCPARNPSWSLEPASPQCSLKMSRSQSLPSSPWWHLKTAVTQRRRRSMFPGEEKYFYSRNISKCQIFPAASRPPCFTNRSTRCGHPRGWTRSSGRTPTPWRLQLKSKAKYLIYIIWLQRWYLKWKGHFTVLVFVKLLL